MSEDRKAKIRERYKGNNTADIKVIPALEQPSFYEDFSEKRVAVYARVSTGSANQTSSYELQKGYYKIIGKMIHHEDEYLFVFDLTAGTMYERETVVDENGKERRKTSRTPVYSSEWVGKFGKPVEEHRQAVQINIFDGYAIYGMKQNKGDPDQRRGG